METSQWIGIGLFVLLVVGIAFLFIRSGTKIKPDTAGKGRSDLGGQP